MIRNSRNESDKWKQTTNGSLSEEIFFNWLAFVIAWLFTEEMGMEQGTDPLKEQKKLKSYVVKATSFTEKAFPCHKRFPSI